MLDNLQEAYTSYQQALYHLHDPKVSSSIYIIWACSKLKSTTRNQDFGMELAYYTTVMVLWNMQKRLSPKSCAWRRTLTRPMKSISDWVLSTSNSRSLTRAWMYVSPTEFDDLHLANAAPVFQIHCQRSPSAFDGGGYLVSNWPCS